MSQGGATATGRRGVGRYSQLGGRQGSGSEVFGVVVSVEGEEREDGEEREMGLAGRWAGGPWRGG